MQLSILFREVWLKIGGEQAAREIENIIDRVTKGFHVEHKGDNTHGVIHCDSISERERDTPIGNWKPIPYDPSTFTTNGAGGITTTLAGYATARYMMLGDTMFLTVFVSQISLAAATGSQIKFRIPKVNGVQLKNAATWRDVNQATDNGAVVASQVRGDLDSQVIDVMRLDGAAWAVTAAGTTIKIHTFFETKT